MRLGPMLVRGDASAATVKATVGMILRHVGAAIKNDRHVSMSSQLAGCAVQS
jgi:hypothetical protein